MSIKRLLLCLFFTATIVFSHCYGEPADRVVGNMMLINDNGSWCWYQDEKIIYDPVGGNILTSTSAHGLGFGGVSGERTNDMDATTFNIATGKRTRVLMRDGGGDDHNMGAFWIRPDGRYLHLYCPHYTNQTTYYRLATNPNDGSAWESEASYNWLTIPNSPSSDTMTSSYTNIAYLTGEGTGNGRLFNIARIFERTPCISYSDDWGANWVYMGRLNGITGTTTYSNFYHKFKGNGVDRIDFIGCEQHPRNYTNSIYHGYIKNGKSYNSYGNQIDIINNQVAPAIGAFTTVWATGPVTAGSYHTGWTNELELDDQGYPVCLFQTRYGTDSYGGATGAADHRFFYGRFDGSTWTSTELAKMGTGLHTPEQDYIGMGCIHPDDANVIYISTPFDPRDDTPLSHHEIFKGVTKNFGATWDWTQITIDSTEDNIRPAISKWDKYNTAVFWTRGSYPGQGQFDMVLVGLVQEQDETLGLVSYIDATESNTEESDGSAFTPTGPSGSAGAADDQWHEYTGYGNGGSCYTAGDGGTENAPTIRTTVTGLSDGTYDVFAYFWCDPDLDWGVRGGFTSSDMLCFNKQSSQSAEASQFSGSVDVINGDYILYRVYIGREEVSGGSSITVYIDDYDSSYNSNAPTCTTYDGIGVASVSYVEDVAPPEPNVMTWASLPSAAGPTSITMTATTATDINPPVYYYFECTNYGDANSMWQTNPTYVAQGLSPSTEYSFRVKARDNSYNQHETDWSTIESATTDPPDTTPPSPNPMQWAVSGEPDATGPYSITMTAATATDAVSPPVEYYFECTTDSTASSSWQSSPTYEATGLDPLTVYTFRVKTRDSYLTPNETGFSGTASATTPLSTDVRILGDWATGTSHSKETGSNRALIFIAHGESTSTMNVSSVTYGGRLMQKVVDYSYNASSGYAYAAAFILDEAHIATALSSTFNPTWSGTAPGSASYASVFLANVDQTDLIGASDSGGSTSPTVTTDPLTTGDGDMVILAATCGNTGGYTLNNGFTEGIDQEFGGTVTGVTGYKAATGQNETPSATHYSVNRQMIIGFTVQKSPTSPEEPDIITVSATGTVDISTQYQAIEGFGGAAVYDVTNLIIHPQRETIYDLLFKDLGIDILRIRNSYGYPDDGASLAATGTIVAEAMEPQRNPNLKIELVPWSPAAYLKNNGSINSGTLAGGPYNYVYQEYAEWWAESLTNDTNGWPSVGIYPDFISLQNEPDWDASYDSCRFNPTQNSSFPGYDQAFEAVYNEVYSRMGPNMPKMWAPCTLSFGNSQAYIDALDAIGQMDHVEGFSFHLYGDGSYDNPDGMISDMQNYKTNYGDYYGKTMHMTEYVKLNTIPDFDMGLKFAWHIYNCLYYQGVHSFFNWTLFRGPNPNGGGIVTMTSSSDYVIRPQYWFLKHYSYFTDPGWYLIDTSTDSSRLRISAFKNPDANELSVVLLNIASDANVVLDLSFGGYSVVDGNVYRTSRTENCVLVGSFDPDSTLNLPPESITTISLSYVPPDVVANAGSNQTVYAFIDGFADVNLDGSGSYEVNDLPLSYYWSWSIDGSDYEANGVSPTIQLPVGEHTIELIADNGTELSEPDYCTVNVVAAQQARFRLICMPMLLTSTSTQPRVKALFLIFGLRQTDIDFGEPLRFYPGGIECQVDSIRELGAYPNTIILMWASLDKDSCKQQLELVTTSPVSYCPYRTLIDLNLPHLKLKMVSHTVHIAFKLTSGRYYDSPGTMMLFNMQR